MQPSCNEMKLPPLFKPVQLTQMMSTMTMLNNQASSFRPGTALQSSHPSGPVICGGDLENSVIVREALRLNLPQHLVLRCVRKRLKSHGSNYTDLRDLVADLFAVGASKDQEVPMETDQLEDAMMMMNSPVVRKALKVGVPSPLIREKLRARIILTGACYADLSELLTDLK